jgi:hypothetical protein
MSLAIVYPPISSFHAAHDARCAGALGHATWAPEEKDRGKVMVANAKDTSKKGGQ